MRFYAFLHNMYDFLIGKIEYIYNDSIGLNVSNIGYKIFTSNPYRFENESNEVKIFIHQVVRETEISLYGFANVEDRELFLKLITVNGIGPKSALAIIAYGDLDGLVYAIETENINYLTQYPGVGPKSAKMISATLKGKLNAKDEVGSVQNELSDAVQALLALGFSNKDIIKVEKELSGIKDLTTDEYIKKGLKILVNNG